MSSTSNLRPLAIFTGYMLSAAVLTVKCISTIRSQAHGKRHGTPRRRDVVIFSLFAAASLATTWYHMFRFFSWSYNEWLGQLDKLPDSFQLGEWLHDTRLFKQAWASTLETTPRAWWSMQIFVFCANWSSTLAVQSNKRAIPHMWVFALLGQVVAISFAMNLSFLSMLYSQPAEQERFRQQDNQDKQDKHEGKIRVERQSRFLDSAAFGHWAIIALSLLWATCLPFNTGSHRFTAMLLMPHALAFFPLFLTKVLPRAYTRFFSEEPSWLWKLQFMALVLSTMTGMAYGEGYSWVTVLGTLYEHPAVSSVGWDVICCWISAFAWYKLGN